MRKNDRGVILLCEAADRLDKTVWCYTELRGLICGTAKGAQSGKNRFGGSLEPFNEVELVLYEKEGTGRPIIESASIVDPTLSLREDWETALSLFSIAEVVIRLSPPQVAQEKIYRLLKAVISAARQRGDQDRLLLYFLIWFLRLEGYVPALEGCSRCGAPLTRGGEIFHSWQEGSFSCGGCARPGDFPLPPTFHLFLRTSRALSPSGFSEISIPGEERVKHFFWEMARRQAGRELGALEVCEKTRRYACKGGGIQP